MNITGTLKVKKEEQKISETFKKREFVLTDTTSSKYPQYISFQLAQNNCELLDSFQTGEEMRVHFNVRGREWQSPAGEIKYFNTLEVWKIEKVNESENASDSGFENQSFPASLPEQESDLPF